MIGERLKAERERLGLTQEAFAAAAGAKRRTLVDWEKGVSSPTSVQLSALVEIGVDATYILTGESTQVTAARAVQNFGPRLRELRGKQHEAPYAEQLGTTPEELAELESGARLPTPEMAMRLAKMHHDKNLLWLLGGDAPRLDGDLTQLEVVLIANYRASSAEGQEMLRRHAAACAEYHTMANAVSDTKDAGRG